MNIPFVDLHAQYLSIKEEIDAAIQDVLHKTAFVGGPHVQSFESNFAHFCGVAHCIGVGNGTDAIFIALKALGIGAGHEVITPANSFIATAEAITQAGARVVFADIDPRTYNLDTETLESRITSKTRAIVPVHIYGQPANMDPVLALAEKHNLKVIEDAAQAHGGMHKGRRVGSMGHAACFSFYPGKNLGAYGDAGAVVTNDEDLARKARMFANHGRIAKYDHEMEGVNSRLDGLQAAILNVKLKHLPQWTRHRQRHALLYHQYLADAPCTRPAELEGVEAVYHLYVVRVAAEARPKLQDSLKAAGISTGIHYPIALPNLKAYKYLGHKESDFPRATMASREILSLPMFPELKEDQIAYVARTLKEALASQ